MRLQLLRFALLLGMVLPWGVLPAQNPVYKPGEYPAPRYPKIPKSPTIEDLMPIARAVVKRDDIGAMFYPGYAIKPGERALIMVGREYDPLVLEAIQRAIREAGGKVDVLLGDEVHPNSKDGTWHGDGSTEFQFFTFMNDVERMQAGGIDREAQLAIALAGKFDVVLSGQGGGIPNIPADKRDKLRWRYLPWDWIDKFMVNANNMPPALLQFIDDVTWDMLLQAKQIHASDPQGTDITWTPQRWNRESHSPGHLMSKPGAAGATGILAGTWNHTGAFPQIRVSIQDDRLAGIEGGGAYGEKWRAVRDQWKEINWPGKQGAGLFTWLQEAALGTNPRSARPKGALDRARANTWERTRAGIIHWGIGSGGTMGEGAGASTGPNPLAGQGPVAAFFRANPSIPTGHVHVHNYFLTMTLTNADGSKTTLIHKGHLTSLDDPKVRAEAAKYGDPDQLLSEDWIPAIPGINVPGDYWKDYASDPVAWTKKDLANWPF